MSGGYAAQARLDARARPRVRDATACRAGGGPTRGSRPVSAGWQGSRSAAPSRRRERRRRPRSMDPAAARPVRPRASGTPGAHAAAPHAIRAVEGRAAPGWRSCEFPTRPRHRPGPVAHAGADFPCRCGGGVYGGPARQHVRPLQERVDRACRAKATSPRARGMPRQGQKSACGRARRGGVAARRAGSAARIGREMPRAVATAQCAVASAARSRAGVPAGAARETRSRPARLAS